MRFWIREIAGWALILLGLFIFYLCLVMLVRERPWLLQAGLLTPIGIFVFRGGIHLLKVAVAARICLHAHRAVREQDAPKKAEAARRTGIMVRR